MSDFRENMRASHNLYLDVAKSDVPMSVKVRVLNEVLSRTNPNAWKIIGITDAALEVFRANDYKYSSGMGINRSHLINRDDSHRHMLDNPLTDIDEWLDYYLANDATVLATSSENKSEKFSEITYFEDLKHSYGEKLFKYQGFGWRHTKQEAAYLKSIDS